MITYHLASPVKPSKPKLTMFPPWPMPRTFGALYKASDDLSLSAKQPITWALNSPSAARAILPLPPSTWERLIASKNQLKSSLEGVYNKTGLVSGRFGTEWSPLEAVSLRVGYKTDTIKERLHRWQVSRWEWVFICLVRNFLMRGCPTATWETPSIFRSCSSSGPSRKSVRT